MDLFILAMQEDEEWAWEMFCLDCGTAIWGHDLYYTTSLCNCEGATLDGVGV